MSDNKQEDKTEKAEATGQNSQNGQDGQNMADSSAMKPGETGSKNDPASSDGEQQEDARSKYNELNDKYLRLYSDFDNYRKRVARERLDLIASASMDVVKAILPVLDDLERANKSNDSINDPAVIKEGLKLIQQKMSNIMARNGVQPMETIGKDFDPELHDAITNIPAPSEEMKGKVVDEVEKGYFLNGKVVRHAKVVVGN